VFVIAIGRLTFGAITLHFVRRKRIASIVMLLTWTNERRLIIFLTLIRWRVYFPEAPGKFRVLRFLNNASLMLVSFFQRLYSAMLQVVCFVVCIRALYRSVNFVII